MLKVFKIKLLRKGAEAELFLIDYFGEKALLKKRTAKKYRNRVLDERIRRERMKVEAVLLNKAKKIGVRTPVIFNIDRKESSILMEFVEGERMKELVTEKNCVEFGKIIALLHRNNIVHGDLTTSNAVVKGKEIALIDFGLGFESEKIEDKAVDFLALKKIFHSSHSSKKKEWVSLKESYKKNYFAAEDVLLQAEDVEKRARYL